MTGQTRPNSLQNIAKDPLEVLHLAFLKWTLGVNRKTYIAAVCGNMNLPSGEAVGNNPSPWNSQSKYSVTMSACRNWSSKGVRKLAWYKKLTELRQTIQDRENNHLNYPCQMRKSLRTTFCEIWEAERKTNKKLGFYNSIKETFGCETYLNIGLSYQEQKRLAQFRTSSHRYKVGIGRYKQK